MADRRGDRLRWRRRLGAVLQRASAAVCYAGTLLQILGLATVATGLSHVRRLFGRPSLGQKTVAWLRQLAAAFHRPKPITARLNATLDDMTLAAEVRAPLSAGPQSPLERRVAILEENLDRLRNEVDAKEARLRRDLSAIKDSLGHEQQAREAENRQITAKMKELAVGGLHLEFVGLTWLFLGVTGASIPDEIANPLSAFLRGAFQLPVPPVRALATLACGW
jgi:hypothetical protein